MGSYTFKWEHPAEEVYVTGTFDSWTKSVKLDKVGDDFQKTVELPDASQKIYYKFVVNNDWVVNESAPKEPDHEGNINNFLIPEQITPTIATINSVTPASTTAAMAATQPIEPKIAEGEPKVIDEKEKPVETPAETKPVEEEVLNEKTTEAPAAEDKSVDLAPVETKAEEAVEATPADDLNKPIGINPLPASEGGVNPITLQPGEKIPESITAQSTDKYVKLDKESYEKADALPGVETELPPVTSNTIPESSLPIADVNDVTLSSVAPTATTASLAAEVPLEKKTPEVAPEVPEIVKESQEKANVEPEAAVESKEVEEKAKVEEELKETVPVAAVTSDGTKEVEEKEEERKAVEKNEGLSDGGLAAIAATAGGAAIAAGLVAKESVEEEAAPVVQKAAETVPEPVKESLPAPVQEALVTEPKEATKEEVSPEVPPEVKESIVESGESPEAATNTEAVEEKKAVESELLEEVKPVPAEPDVKPEEVKPVAVEPEVKPEEVKAPALETEAIKTEEPATEAPKIEETKPEEVQTEAVKTEEPVVETKTEESKAVEPVTDAPQVEETKPEEVQTEAVKPEEPKSEAPVTSTENGANGTENGSKASEPAANGSSKEQKKKHRISAFFNKLKSKLN